jgi:hypothetical protein
MSDSTFPNDPVSQPANTTEPAATTQKQRSETTYPYFGLSKAIEIVMAVRRAGGQEAAFVDVQRELKIDKPTDRMWSYGVPTAVQFGLVERIGRGADGRLRISPLGMRVVYPANEEEAQSARVEATLQPDLYCKLVERFRCGPVPSKDGLRNLLIRDYKIVESMASNAAEAFLDSIRVAGLVDANGLLVPEDAPERSELVPEAKGATPEENAATTRDTQLIQVPSTYIVYKCKISGGCVIELPLPPKLSATDVKKLHAFLETQVDDDEEVPGS